MKLSLLFLFSFTFLFFAPNERLEQVQADVETRIWKQGNSTRVHSTVYYHMDGRMITRFTHPFQRIMRTNHLGEMLLYDQETGEVTRQQNPTFSSEGNHFFHFFQNRTEEMGLDQLGFEQGDTEFQENLRITNWYAPTWLAQTIDYVQLVHQGFRPIHMAVYDRKGQTIQKTYFHNYTEIHQVDFPLSITTISYDSPADSSVSQTRFSNIRINSDTDRDLFEIHIPDPDESNP